MHILRLQWALLWHLDSFTRFFRFEANCTSLDLENSLSLRMLIRLPFSCKYVENFAGSRLKYPARTQGHFFLRIEIKNVNKRRSSSLAGIFSIALDSVIDSQNFFHAFKSLLVLYWVFFFISAPAKMSQFRLHLWSQLPRQDSNLPKLARFLYLLPREGPLILPLSIINRKKPIFSYSLFVTFWGQLLQDRSRCRSRWENLDRGQDRFLESVCF